jgi:hypothetical protein
LRLTFHSPHGAQEIDNADITDVKRSLQAKQDAEAEALEAQLRAEEEEELDRERYIFKHIVNIQLFYLARPTYDRCRRCDGQTRGFLRMYRPRRQ